MANLTDGQKGLVTSSWNLVQQDFKNNSIAFFLFFFETHPEHKKRFKSFADKDLDELKKSVKLRSHAARVFYAISSLIENLDDLDMVVDIVQKTVGDHNPRGIGEQEYTDLFNTIVAFLEKELGEKFCADTKLGWVNVAGILMGVITKELKKEALR